MESEEFVASRITRGNLLFPTKLVVSPTTVMRRKRSWLSVHEESVHIRNVATVNIRTGIWFSDIRIESSGGSDPLDSHGHSKGDARRIKELIETYQARLGPKIGEVTIDPGDGKSCPWCGETIRGSAKICRYCNRDVS